MNVIKFTLRNGRRLGIVPTGQLVFLEITPEDNKPDPCRTTIFSSGGQWSVREDFDCVLNYIEAQIDTFGR